MKINFRTFIQSIIAYMRYFWQEVRTSIPEEEIDDIIVDDASEIDDDCEVCLIEIDNEVPAEEDLFEVKKPKYLWCFDNGHGKHTRGKRSPIYENDNGVQCQFLEYEFNRDIVRRLSLLCDEAGIKYFVVVPEIEIGNALEERVKRANEKKSHLPKIFLSIHSNAGPTAKPNDWVVDKISGIEVWFYHNSSKGKKLASTFQKHLIKATGWKNRHIKSRQKNQFYVLKKSKMPAILTENGFYNNRKQVEYLQSPVVRQIIAHAHFLAIKEIEKNGL